MRPIINMLVELDNFCADQRAHEALLAAAKLTLISQHGASQPEVDWIATAFGGSWPREAQAGWNWFVRDARGDTRGFVTYEQRALRYWWLDQWLDKSDVGIFGPMGVDVSYRGKGVGGLLTQRALVSLKELGFQRALIPAAGPVEFYEHCCGARIVERLERP